MITERPVGGSEGKASACQRKIKHCTSVPNICAKSTNSIMIPCQQSGSSSFHRARCTLHEWKHHLLLHDYNVPNLPCFVCSGGSNNFLCSRLDRINTRYIYSLIDRSLDENTRIVLFLLSNAINDLIFNSRMQDRKSAFQKSMILRNEIFC